MACKKVFDPVSYCFGFRHGLEQGSVCMTVNRDDSLSARICVDALFEIMALPAVMGHPVFIRFQGISLALDRCRESCGSSAGMALSLIFIAMLIRCLNIVKD